METELVYGIQPVLQVFLAKKRRPLQLLFHRTHLSPELKKILHLSKIQKVSVEERDKHALSQMAQTPQHQGIVLKTDPYTYVSFEELRRDLKSKPSPGLVLILDQIQDPQNLGAILRTAACAAVQGVILPEKGSALVNPTVMKASAGAAEWVPVCLVPSLTHAIDALKKIPFWVYGTEAGEHPPFWESNFRDPTALILGNEGVGVRNLIKKKCDFLISIPLLGTIPALNVSVATGVLLFEVLRQRKNLKSP